MAHKKLVVKSYDDFVLEKYVHSQDRKPVSAFTENQIMNAIGLSKTFSVRSWFGYVDEVNFTIVDITKNKDGDYVYTIDASMQVPDEYFPLVAQICEGHKNVAFPTLTTIMD